MKKQLLLAAAFVAALFGTVNAQTHNFAGIQASDITISPAGSGTIGTYKLDEVDVPSISYASTDQTVMEVSFAGKNNVKLTYKNSAAKNNILKCGGEYLQTDGKNAIIVLSNLTAGTAISMEVKAKGGTAAVFEGTGCTADASNPASVDNTEFKTLKFTATGSEASIKETAGGYRITTLIVGNSTNISSSAADKAIVATEYYNVAGIKMNAAQKGLNIVKNIFEDGTSEVTKAYIK